MLERTSGVIARRCMHRGAGPRPARCARGMCRHLYISCCRVIDMHTETRAGTAGPIASGGVMFQTFPYHSTRELLGLNRIYIREFRENPTDSARRAVELTDAELTRRGA